MIPEAALDARTEAVDILRELAAGDPDRYKAKYKRTPGELRREHERRGWRDEAVKHHLGAAPATDP